MDKLETEARTYTNVTVLPFLLSETASKSAAFLVLPDKAWGTSGRYGRCSQGFSGRGAYPKNMILGRMGRVTLLIPLGSPQCKLLKITQKAFDWARERLS